MLLACSHIDMLLACSHIDHIAGLQHINIPTCQQHGCVPATYLYASNMPTCQQHINMTTNYIPYIWAGNGGEKMTEKYDGGGATYLPSTPDLNCS